ncbi:MAG: glycosyltransferase [Oscillospiraceae bacterium]|nr:glycosyltransferase [Oscillospiraceae bacterium]
MKVCLLNDSFPPVIDGVANVVINYARYLQSEHDCSVVVGTPRYPDADYSSYSYPVIPYQSFDTAAVASGYRTGNPFAEKEVSQLAAFQPDIIHTHCPASATVIARILREKVDSPVIFTYHTKYDIDIRRTVPFRPVADEGIRMMVRNIEACDDIWVVSRGAGESLKALGFEGDYRVMNNGVDFARGRVEEREVAAVTAGYDLPAGVPMFLFVGRMMTYKGLPLILDALGMLHDAGQDFRMVFIGKGPDQQLLEEKAASLGIGDKCIFIGPIYDRNILRAWNTRADLFLFPSTFDTNGLVVREAAACGLASVLIKDSCAAEGVTDGRNGFLIDETPEAMAALLKEICGDLAHLHQVGEMAMEEIYLSWEDCVSAAYERYAAVLEEKKAGTLPKKKKLATDYLVSLTAQRMTDLEQFRRVKNELFNGFRETAEGMMENIQDASESAEHLIDLSEDFIKDFYHLFKH